MGEVYKILVAEDDFIIARTIKDHLLGWGYDVHVSDDFARVSQQVAELLPNMVLLDIGLPFYNGFHWCAEIRKFSKVPVMFISSADDNMNIVMAMNMGGDDFIAKPFDLNVLTAKVQALLRRTYAFVGQHDTLERKDAVLNLGSATLTYRGEQLELTKNEYRIMLALMEQAGRVITRDALMLRLWESDSFVDDNTLTVNINRLRKKLADAGLIDFIKTKKGIGYEIE